MINRLRVVGTSSASGAIGQRVLHSLLGCRSSRSGLRRGSTVNMDPTVPCVRTGDYALRFETELGENFEERAWKEVRETPERRQEALKELIRLIEGKLCLSVIVTRISTYL